MTKTQTSKEKGPASAPTLPDLGSRIHPNGEVMNMDTHITGRPDTATLTRRSFLWSTAVAGAAVTAVALPAAAETMPARADLTAIPTDIVDKIKAWQHAHRGAVAAANAYSASLNVTPINKPECDRCFYAMVAANGSVAPAREAMIMALWGVS